MPEKSYKARGYTVFNKSGMDLPANQTKYDEFEEILIEEKRRKLTNSWLPSTQQVAIFIKRWLRRFLTIGAILFILGTGYACGVLRTRLQPLPSSVVVVTATPEVIVEEAPTQMEEPTQTDIPVPALDPTTAPTATCILTVKVIGNEAIIVRRGPGTNFQQVDSAQAGARLPFVRYSPNRTWVQIREERWVFANLVSQPSCE